MTAAGALVARAALDFERAREHALTVRATDGVTGAFADASVTLRLLDVNDCAPELDRDLYRATVSEAAAVGDLVLRVRATDNDTGRDRRGRGRGRAAAREPRPTAR